MRSSGGLDPGDAVIVVTGASSGIGKATATELARRGARLSLAARDAPSLHQAALRCRASGAEVLEVPTDVSDEASVDALADRTLERFGRIDGWINNAAVMAYGSVEEIPTDTFRQVVETNLMGTVHGSRAALRSFRRQDAGILVNVASLYAKLTSPYVSPYIASKYGVLGFSRSLREELADHDDINVSVILPEAVDTPIFEQAANHTDREVVALPPAMDPDRVVRAITSCLDRPRPEVTVGVIGRVATHGQRTLRRLASSRLYDRLAKWAMDRVALGGVSRRRTNGNVFEPRHERERIDGGWRRERRGARRLAALAALATVAAPLIVRWWSRD